MAKVRAWSFEKDKDGWILPAHFSAPVDGNKVKVLLDKLAGMKQGFVVATSADAAKRFKVDAEVLRTMWFLEEAEKHWQIFMSVLRRPFARSMHGEEIVMKLSPFLFRASNWKAQPTNGWTLLW